MTGFATEYNHACLVVERNNHGSGVLALAKASAVIRGSIANQVRRDGLPLP